MKKKDGVKAFLIFELGTMDELNAGEGIAKFINEILDAIMANKLSDYLYVSPFDVRKLAHGKEDGLELARKKEEKEARKKKGKSVDGLPPIV